MFLGNLNMIYQIKNLSSVLGDLHTSLLKSDNKIESCCGKYKMPVKAKVLIHPCKPNDFIDQEYRCNGGCHLFPGSSHARGFPV